MMMVLMVFTSKAQQYDAQIMQEIQNQHDVNICSFTKQKMLAKKLKGVKSMAGSNIDITYSRCEWYIDPSVADVSGKITSYFKTLQNLTQFNLELDHGLTVDSILYHGAEITYADSSTYLLNIYFPNTITANMIDSVSIYYHGTPSSSGFGSYIQSTHAGTPIIWTLSEPYGAREWWPSKNDLNDKIDSIDVIVTCPTGNRAASNGVLISEQHGAVNSVYHWRHRHPITAYLVAFAVTNYIAYSDYAQLTVGQVEVLNYVYPEDSSYAVTHTPNVISSIQLYSQLFIDYPFKDEKYGHAQFGWGGGMEHQTMSFMGGFSHALMAHELAHQWFGDMVTCGSWQDIWLNEGFATYLTGLTYEAAPNLPYWETWKRQTINDITSQPDGSVFCTDTTSVGRIFSSRLSYSKGAYVLHMLRWVIGDTAFFGGLRNYLQDPNLAYGYAVTDDLKQHLEASSGMSLTEFLADWFYGEGYPIYDVEINQTSETDINIKIDQTTSDNSVSFFEMPVPFKVYYDDGTDTTFVLDHTSSGQVFQITTKVGVDSVAFDPDRHIACLHTVSSNVGIQKVTNDAQIFVYPNPVTNQLTINSQGKEINEIAILNVQGKLIERIQFSGNKREIKLDMTHYVTGCYFLRITGNESTYIQKIIKN